MDNIPEGHAMVSLTWKGQSGFMRDPVYEGTPASEILDIAEEAIRSGAVQGIEADPGASLSGFHVENLTVEGNVRIAVYPKVAFG